MEEHRVNILPCLWVMMGSFHQYAGSQNASGELYGVSTLAGEILVLADGIDSAVFLATIYSELTHGDCTQKFAHCVCNG